jgi:hypothetical protein
MDREEPISKLHAWSIVGLIFGSLFAMVACPDTDAVIQADRYNQSCDNADDCMAVQVGEICRCTCEYAAINKASSDAYESDVDAANCPPDPDCNCELTGEVGCVNDICTIVEE